MVIGLDHESEPGCGDSRGDVRYWKCMCEACGKVAVLGTKYISDHMTCGCRHAGGRAQDLAGQRFGRLVALEQVHPAYWTKTKALWRCRCDCGTELNVCAASLTKDRTHSCGCLRGDIVRERRTLRLDGRTFALLKVIGRAPGPDGTFNGESFWRCVCACGRETVVRGRFLVNGSTRSCGCLHRKAVREEFARQEALRLEGGVS
ncbi:MAG: hypothetical protein MJ058_04225 [Akkermansia sp.]|nr:hypothetical protein [Akkermansia sp.]